MKADKQLQDALNDCIDHLLQGETVQECLGRYPHLVDTLAPLLRVASTTLQATTCVRSTPELRARILAQVLARGQSRAQKRGWLPQALRPWLLAPMTAVLLVGAFWGISSASASSIPGDPLYPVKTVRERVALAVTRSPEGKARLSAALARRRAEEVEILMARGEDEERLEELFKHMAVHARQAADYWTSISEEEEERRAGAPPADEGTLSILTPGPPTPWPPRAAPTPKEVPPLLATRAVPLPPGLARKEAVRLEVRRALMEHVQAQEARWQEALRRAPPHARPRLEQAHSQWRQQVQEALQTLDKPVLPPLKSEHPDRPSHPRRP